MRSIARALIVIVCAAAPYAAAQTTLDELRKQVSEAELELGKSRFTLPDCSNGPAAELAAHIKAQAAKSNLKTVTIQPVEGSETILLDDGRPSPLRLNRIDISGRGPFEDVDLLLRRIAMQRLVRVIDFESMAIAASAGGTVTFNARVATACWEAPPPPPSPPYKAPRSANSVDDIIAPMYRQKLDLLLSELTAVSKVNARFKPYAALDSLAALDNDWKTRAAALTEFRLSHGTATLTGVVLGAQARAGLDASLKQAGFDAGHVATSKTGDCYAFSATAPVASDEERPHGLAFDLFDERASTLCSANVTQSPIPIRSKGTGKLTLHLRDADVADFFLVLNAISPHDAFIVEPDVKGRINVDLDSVTAAEALAAVRKAGVAFVGPGPLHRVCRAECGAATATSKKYDGELITLTVRDAGILDLLRTFEKITGLTISVPRTLEGHIAVFAQDLPWDRIFDGLVSAFHLTYRIEGDHVSLGTGTPIALADAGKAHSASYRRPWSALRDLASAGADDIHLAALAGSGGTWSAYAYAPGSSRTLLPLDPGRKLFDASIAAVGPAGVTLKTTRGQTIILPLP
jgi:hypothetical protein